MNILRPLNPLDTDTFTTYEKAMEAFKCDPPKDGEEVSENSDERKHESKAYEGGVYTLMPRANTNALGVQALRNSFKGLEIPEIHAFLKKDKGAIVRPLTFKENILARVEDFNTETDPSGCKRTIEDRLRFFSRWLNSCTGIAYKAGTTKFKLIPQCEELITIPSNFKGDFMPINYDLIASPELDSSDLDNPCNEWLSKEAARHPSWASAVEDDYSLLNAYCEIVFSNLWGDFKSINRIAMAFLVASKPIQDQLKALSVSSLDYLDNSYSDCNGYLNNFSYFLRGSKT